jgi:hypothetical protein
VAHDPVIVGGVHRQQVHPARVDHPGSVGRQQPPFGFREIGDHARHVVIDLDRGEVVDRARPRVVAVQQRRGGIDEIARACVGQRPLDRLVHQRLLQVVLPVPGARVVVDREGILERGAQGGSGAVDGLETTAVG